MQFNLYSNAKVGGLSCFVQQTHTTLSKYHKQRDDFTMVKRVFLANVFLSGNKAKVAISLCHMKLVTPV